MFRWYHMEYTTWKMHMLNLTVTLKKNTYTHTHARTHTHTHMHIHTHTCTRTHTHRGTYTLHSVIHRCQTQLPGEWELVWFDDEWALLCYCPCGCAESAPTWSGSFVRKVRTHFLYLMIVTCVCIFVSVCVHISVSVYMCPAWLYECVCVWKIGEHVSFSVYVQLVGACFFLTHIWRDTHPHVGAPSTGMCIGTYCLGGHVHARSRHSDDVTVFAVYVTGFCYHFHSKWCKIWLSVCVKKNDKVSNILLNMVDKVFNFSSPPQQIMWDGDHSMKGLLGKLH